jgi:hypothetical protein
MTAAFAEADEVLRIKDGPDDYACQFHFTKGRIIPSVWKKKPRPGEGTADLALRQGNYDIEDAEDAKQVEATPGSIKIVGRIDYCDKEGPAMLNKTQILGCAFSQNGTFAMRTEILADTQRRGVVIAHEYGHNVCNRDTSDPTQVMYGFAGTDPTISREVTAAQCQRYTAPKGSLCKQTTRQERQESTTQYEN